MYEGWFVKMEDVRSDRMIAVRNYNIDLFFFSVSHFLVFSNGNPE